MQEYIFELWRGARPDGEGYRPRVHAQGRVAAGSDSRHHRRGRTIQIGVFSLLDDLNSAFVDVRKRLRGSCKAPSSRERSLRPSRSGRMAGTRAKKSSLGGRSRRLAARSARENGIPMTSMATTISGSVQVRGPISALVHAPIRATAAEHFPRGLSARLRQPSTFARSDQCAQQHRGGFRAGQHGLRLDPPLALFVQSPMVSLSNHDRMRCADRFSLAFRAACEREELGALPPGWRRRRGISAAICE
jgi:hypothetical protein